MGYKTYTCPIAKRCGGCEWLAVPYPIQLKRKEAYVHELFGQMAAEDGAHVAPVVGMVEPMAYRHKAATPFAPAPRGRIRCGFYEAGTHRIVFSKECLVEAPGLRALLVDVARTAERLHVNAYAEDRQRGVLRHAVARAGYATDDVLLTLVTNGPQLPHERELVRQIRNRHPEVTSIVQNVNQRHTNAILGHANKTLYGPGLMHDKLLGCTFEVGPSSFYQTNPAQTQKLYALALEGARLEAGQRVLDAYCGTGTIGICAAAAADVQVTGVEQVAQAIASAQRNAEANGVAEHCGFVAADATAYIQKAARTPAGAGTGTGAAGFDVVIMDPPRAGSTPEFLASVAALAPRRVVYVSCNAATQARDLAQLRAAGYRLEALTPVDMFPHTKHVETVAALVRK